MGTEDEVRGLLDGSPTSQPGRLTARTAFTVEDLDELLQEVDRARALGYGRQVSEAEIGVAALAVPISRPSGSVLCALTLTGPDTRMDARPGSAPSDTELGLLDLLRRAAEAISAGLHL